MLRLLATIIVASAAYGSFGRDARAIANATADLAVSKTSNASNGYVSAGQNVEYAINVTNLSAVSATNVVVTETVPVNSTFVKTTDPFDPFEWRLPSGGPCVTGAPAGTVCIATVANTLAPNETVAQPFTVMIDLTAPVNSAVTNTVAVRHSGPDPVSANSIYTLTTPIDPRRASGVKTAVLALDNNGNGLADPGDEIDYTLVVSNSGPITLMPLTIEDPSYEGPQSAPPRVATVLQPSITASSGTVQQAGNGFRVTRNTALPNASVSIGYRERIDAALPGYVVSATNQARFSTNLAGIGAVTLGYSNRTGILLAPRRDLALLKTVRAASPNTGATQFELRYGNLGAIDAENVVITESIPSGAVFDAAGSTPGWSCAGTQCVFGIGTLTGTLSESGYAGVLTFTLAAAPDLPATQASIAASAGIYGTGDDSYPQNNTVTLAAPIGQRATYKVTQQFAFARDLRSDNKLELTDAVTYTLRLTNTSATRAGANLQIQQFFPTIAFGQDSYMSLDPFSLTTSKGAASSDGSSVTVDIGTLNPSESVTVSFRASLDVLPPALLNGINTKTTVKDVFGSAAQSNSVRLRVFYAREISSFKTMQSPRGQGLVVAGDTVTFTVFYTNTGIEPIADWVLRDGEGAPNGVITYGCMRIDAASIISNRGTVSAFTNGFGDPGFTLSPGSLPVGAGGSLSYTAQIKTTAPCVDGKAFNMISTYEGIAGNLFNRSSPTAAIVRGPRTPIGILRVRPARGVVDVIPGEALDISIQVINAGTGTLNGVRLIHGNYSCFSIDPASLNTTQGTIGLGTQSPPELSARVSQLEPDQSFTVSFKATVDRDPGCTEISSVGDLYDVIATDALNQTLPFAMPIVEKHSRVSGGVYLPMLAR